MSFPLVFAAAVVIFVVAQCATPTEGYGPWPGARAAETPPPLRSRPRDYRDVELRPTLPESRLPARPLGTAPQFRGGASDATDPLAPMAAERIPLKTEILDVFSPNVPAYEGKARLSSACLADDTTTIASILSGAQLPTGWTPLLGDLSAADPNSRGRNVSGLLRGVELSA